jgi:hypothetical protein
MSEFDVPRVASHIRRLDGDGLAALVADLWAARGYETTRDGTDIVASHGAETVRIRVSAGGRWRRTAPAVVVSRDGDDRAEGRAVDAVGLAEMLGYAVNRPTARDICRRHLGAPPETLGPPPVERVRTRASAPASPGQALAAAVLAGLVVLVLVGVVGGLPTVFGTDSGGDLSGDGTVGTETPTANESVQAEPAGAARDGHATGTPPGVSASGIEDVEALARAHARAVANRSYTVWVDWYRPRNFRPGGTRVQRDIDVATEGDRYLIETTEVVADNRTHTGAIYHDGAGTYAAVWNGTSGEYERVFAVTQRRVTVPTSESIRQNLVRRYLSTPETDITEVQSGTLERRNGRRLFRITGTGAPNVSSTATIRNYSVEAMVDSRGFVRNVTVQATVEHPQNSGQTLRIEREYTYDRVDSTTVEPPEWYLNHTD